MLTIPHKIKIGHMDAKVITLDQKEAYSIGDARLFCSRHTTHLLNLDPHQSQAIHTLHHTSSTPLSHITPHDTH